MHHHSTALLLPTTVNARTASLNNS